MGRFASHISKHFQLDSSCPIFHLRNFRKKILSFESLKETDREVESVPYRAPALYRFEEVKYRKLVRDGLRFDL